MDTNFLIGEKISLRAMEPEDLELLYTLENDAQNWDISSVNVPYSKYALKQYIANCTNDIYADKQIRLIIEENQSKQAIGTLDLIDFNPRHHRAELGIVIAKAQQGKGYAAETLNLIDIYATKFLELNQVYAYVSDNNEISIKLFQKAGYETSSTLKDWIMVNGEYENVIFFQKFFGKKVENSCTYKK